MKKKVFVTFLTAVSKAKILAISRDDKEFFLNERSRVGWKGKNTLEKHFQRL
nr:hypothetical protein [Evansella caseinilytica]